MKNLLSILVILFTFSFYSCNEKDEQLTLPVLTTAKATEITYTTAISGGELKDIGGAYITAKGICWSTSVEPTTLNDTTMEAGGLGAFTCNLSNLTPNTMYYVRAYGINSVGTAYGNEVAFKTNPVEVPVLSTQAATNITQTSIQSGGNIIDSKGGSIITKGLCWSIVPDPSILDSKTDDGTGPGEFTSALSGLNPNTTYYIRAYATNSEGTGYGPVVAVATLSIDLLFNPNLTYGTITDADANIYKTIVIGTQTWMAENLKTTRYNDNTSIPFVGNYDNWGASTPAYCWYKSDPAYKTTYGALYNWYAVNTGKLCPIGWHVASDEDWTTLMNFLGGAGVAGNKIKESGTGHWSSPNEGATNESGFTAVPNGCRNFGGTFGDIKSSAYIWSSTEYGTFNGLWRLINFNDNLVNKTYEHKEYGFSARCIKD